MKNRKPLEEHVLDEISKSGPNSRAIREVIKPKLLLTILAIKSLKKSQPNHRYSAKSQPNRRIRVLFKFKNQIRVQITAKLTNKKSPKNCSKILKKSNSGMHGLNSNLIFECLHEVWLQATPKQTLS